MSTGMIIVLIVIVAVVVLVAAGLALRARGGHGGPNLKRRFGPEYERTVARHDGDTKAAERELTERVERHGKLRERPLEPAERDRYTVRWAAVQEHFVQAPREAVAEADGLLAEVAGARGYPDAGHRDEQLDALSVHHAHHLDGYRRVHRMATVGAGENRGTEELRTALVEARALFDDLIDDNGGRNGRHGADADASADGRTAVGAGTGHGAGTSQTRSHMPWSSHKGHPKES
ncbi:hypothetical protein KUM39_05135 [Streptomyces sp. J2-1]|uniref:hypothetical protein n=1 Tax=Streptomyces corallincola TaxID=2851888 RepID=UPI001C385C21|nr:hypothetical protein [Streptomyces corallincola]MBV2353749.1 hypothetical protein [Streptomyces corallincola]